MAGKITLNISRKEVVMVCLFAVMLGLYLIYGAGCFRVVPMRIEDSVRPSISLVPAGSTEKPKVVYVTSFAFDREYELTSVKIYRVQDLDLTGNKNGAPLWHLVGKPKSTLTRSLVYGSTLPGMATFVPGINPPPLEANVAYRIVAEAGRLRGEHDFTITAQDAGASR